jgi:hypothetical protein
VARGFSAAIAEKVRSNELTEIDGAVPPDEVLEADALVLVLPPLALEDEELLQAAAARHKASDTDATPAPFVATRII